MKVRRILSEEVMSLRSYLLSYHCVVRDSAGGMVISPQRIAVLVQRELSPCLREPKNQERMGNHGKCQNPAACQYQACAGNLL